MLARQKKIAYFKNEIYYFDDKISSLDFRLIDRDALFEEYLHKKSFIWEIVWIHLKTHFYIIKISECDIFQSYDLYAEFQIFLLVNELFQIMSIENNRCIDCWYKGMIQYGHQFSLESKKKNIVVSKELGKKGNKNKNSLTQ